MAILYLRYLVYHQDNIIMENLLYHHEPFNILPEEYTNIKFNYTFSCDNDIINDAILRKILFNIKHRLFTGMLYRCCNNFNNKSKCHCHIDTIFTNVADMYTSNYI